MNPYEILGVTKESSKGEIKKAYRDLAKKYHPDQNDGDPELEEKFKQVSQAYEILSDPKKKSEYDRFGKVGQRGNMDDAFADFFGRAQPRRRQRKKSIHPDIRAGLRISLSDAIFGCSHVYEIVRGIACEKCKCMGGTHNETDCSHCNGQGYVKIDANFANLVSNCGACQGTGKSFSPCDGCEGQGYTKKTEKVEVVVPPNAQTQQVLCLEGKGNEVLLSNGERHTGSHYLVIDFTANEKGIAMRGNNLFTSIHVPIDKILAEDTITVNCFDKKKVDLKLQSDAKPNQVYSAKIDFIPNGRLNIKVLPQIPSKYVDVDSRNKLVKALREAYGESESIISPNSNGA
jgi:molecular chaperone DnaJ